MLEKPEPGTNWESFIKMLLKKLDIPTKEDIDFLKSEINNLKNEFSKIKSQKNTITQKKLSFTLDIGYAGCIIKTKDREF